jgi:pimeloyl-ACP methyl ester carboxylesterase
MWDGQVAALGADHRVIAPDLRGHGETPPTQSSFSIDDMADDVVETLDTLAISSEPIVLAGLSMGGYVALSLVLRRPERVRGLILLDTRAGADTPEAAQVREANARAVLETGDTRPLVDAMVPRLFWPDGLERNRERVAATRAVMERTSPRGVAGALAAMASRPDRRSDLARIRVPTLVVVGEFDAITPPAEAMTMADAINDARLEVIPEAGHMAPLENPSVTNAVILRFLASLEPPQ